MSDKTYDCDICLLQLPAAKFSKAQVNKLEHNKLKSIHCLECTDNIQVAIENERVQKIKEDKKELKRKKKLLSMDPSSKYTDKPLGCPIVQDAMDYFQSKKIDFKVNLGKTKEWRTVAKIAVRGIVTTSKREDGTSSSSINTVFGLFKPGTHEVIEIAECNAHHKSINKAIQLVKKACVAAKVNGYVEGTGSSKAENLEWKTYLKYVLFAVERSSGRVQLSLVWNTEPEGANKDGDYFLKSLVNVILKESGSGSIGDDGNALFHSIWVNYNPSSRYDNCITSRGVDSWRLLYGSEYVLETINPASITTDNPTTATATTVAAISVMPRLRFPPFVFRQANIDAFSNIIHSIRRWIPSTGSSSGSGIGGGVRCVELYGGVGTIGLNCLDLVSRLSCSDENPHNKVCFELTLADMLRENQGRKSSSVLGSAVYDSRSASGVSVSGGLRGCDLVIVDPPRKGLDEEVIQALLSENGSLFDSGAASVTEGAAAKAGLTIGGVNVAEAAKGKKKIYFGEESASSTAAATSDSALSVAAASAAAPSTHIKRLIYVSCGFKAFKRDCARLLGESVEEYSANAGGDAGLAYDGYDDEGETEQWGDGRSSKKRRTNNEESATVVTVATATGKQRFWRLVHAEGHVLFPGSDHIETFAVFDRL